MIPALATAYVNRPDLLWRMNRSIDVPVEHLIVVNNSRESEATIRAHSIERQSDTEVLGLGVNVFTSGAWNMIQDRVFNQLNLPWVLIVGSDVEWHPGDLEIFEKTVQQSPVADFFYGPLSYNQFIVMRSGFEKVGAFDENAPVYLSDSCHWNTIRQLGDSIKVVGVEGPRSRHDTSSAVNSDPVLADKVRLLHEQSWDYYSRRFGCPRWSEGKETFKTPFNDPLWLPNFWELEDKSRPHYWERYPA